MKVWKYPLPTLFDDENNTMGSFKMLPTMDPVNLLCRVYVVKVIPFYILRARSLISGFPAWISSLSSNHQRRVWNLVEHLQWSVFARIVNGFVSESLFNKVVGLWRVLQQQLTTSSC